MTSSRVEVGEATTGSATTDAGSSRRRMKRLAGRKSVAAYPPVSLITRRSVAEMLPTISWRSFRTATAPTR